MTCKETVQQLYAAFGRGDVPAVLERLAPDVEWEYDASPTEVPWLRVRVPALPAAAGVDREQGEEVPGKGKRKGNAA